MDQNPIFDQLTAELRGDSAVGLLLAVQLGQSPRELRAIVRTNTIRPGGAQPIHDYLITMRNMLEHQVTLGVFDSIALYDDHILLQHHNAASYRLFISGTAEYPDAALDALEDAYVDMFGGWRPSIFDSPDKLIRVLTTGFGTLGEMPEPFARRASAILTEQRVPNNLVVARPALDPPLKLLMVDAAYFVAFRFEFECLSS
ncbi:MAG TPA: hypothetical protein VMT34_09035 [Aggregatilineales bacterium]|nr:hypothetical protein [Aggregatilineales bacterium]